MKILILGSGGSGKSTLAKEVSKHLDIELIHLDAHYWEPGWVMPNKDEWDQKLNELLSLESWVMDGNYQRTISKRLSHADHVIFIDMPRLVCLYRIVKRRIMFRNKSRPDMKKGCNEKLDFAFVKWVWVYNSRNKKKVLTLIDESDVNLTHLKGRNEVKRFLNVLKSSKSVTF